MCRSPHPLRQSARLGAGVAPAAPFPYAYRKARDRLMYTIELTEGPGWDAPTLQARAIKTTVDIAKVAALAADWLHETQQSPSDAHRPDGWRNRRWDWAAD